jgi:hypothetical protein
MSFSEYAAHRKVAPQTVTAYASTGKITRAIYKNEHGKVMINSEIADELLDAILDPAKKQGAEARARNRELRAQGLPIPGGRPNKEYATEESSSAQQSGSKVPSYMESKSIKEAFLARITQLEYDEMRGKLISAEKVRTDAFVLGRTLRDAIMAVPDRISAQLASESDQHAVHRILLTELTLALEELVSAQKRAEAV